MESISSWIHKVTHGNQRQAPNLNDLLCSHFLPSSGAFIREKSKQNLSKNPKFNLRLREHVGLDPLRGEAYETNGREGEGEV